MDPGDNSNKKKDLPANRPLTRRMTSPAITVPAGFGQNDTHLDAALARIFHPEQFSPGHSSHLESPTIVVSGSGDPEAPLDPKAPRRMSRRKASDVSMLHIHGVRGGNETKNIDKMVERMFGPKDLSPKNLFVQMSELEGEEWVEQARWIKYEEVREIGAERWGRAHISTLTFHSLINLRLCLETGVMLLDMEAWDLPGVAYGVVEELFSEGIIEEEQRADVLRALLHRHKYVVEKGGGGFFFTGIKRNLSTVSLRRQSSVFPSKGPLTPAINQAFSPSIDVTDPQSPASKKSQQLGIEMLDDHNNASHHHRTNSVVDFTKVSPSKRDSIMQCLKEGTEGTLTMVGSLDCLEHPVVAFVRLAEGVVMPNALEVLLPVRFIFILLTPDPSPNMDYHEVGRSFSTLMSNPTFQNSCYKVDDRNDLLSAINDFLDDSVVLPPGDFESKNLLSIEEIQDIKKRRQERKEQAESQDPNEERKKAASPVKMDEKGEEKGGKDDGKEEKEEENSPLVRTRRPFGGLVNDVKRRFPHYWSDIKDGINLQCLSTGLFIYFACLSPAIAFGGLYGDKTEFLIGVPVTLLVSCVGQVCFALFAGNPLVITGVTGPILLFDEALYNFSKRGGVEFLPWRVWLSFWLILIALVVAAFEGSTCVKFFTKFTKDIFATLIALIYIFEAMKKLSEVFKHHPMTSLDVYCNASIEATKHSINDSFFSSYDGKGFSLQQEEDLFSNITSFPHKQQHDDGHGGHDEEMRPNAALLSFILMIGTFVIAYQLKIFRNGKYLSRTVRRSLGDFGVPIAIVVMVTIDYLIKDNFTDKLNVPVGLQLTAPEKRGWIINPMGIHEGIPAWAPFAAVIPAALLYLLLFMETEICELLMMEKANKKGSGLHWDIVLVCLVNVFNAIIGGPWICAATVRAVSHVAALSIMSTTHAPGESAKIVDVLDQRLSGLFVGIMLGVSVMLGPVLQLIPTSVLFGVFIYMGISAIFGGIQMFDRAFLLFKPVKYHPQVSYVGRVKTWKMHMFTGFQFFGLAVLWTVKSVTAISLFFPFFVVAMIPLRMSLKFLFTPKELNALDGPKAGQEIKDDEPDFYDQAYGN